MDSSASFPPAPRDLGRVIAGRYRLDARCGEGSFAEVYQAFDQKHDGTLAVKLLLREHAVVPDLRARFAREIELLARVDHPHVVRMLDSGEDDGQPYLVMPLLRGESLRMVLRHRPGGTPLPWREGAELVRQLLRALEALHAAGIVHRDLKPANAMVTLVPRTGPHLVLIDLGLAARRSPDASIMPSADFGAPAYRAPELWRGEPADVRSDIYSAGVIFYEILTGALPFTGTDLRAQHLGGELVPPRTRAPRAQIPESIEALVLRALDRDPAGRFPGAAAFIDQLESELERLKLRLPPGYHLVARDLAGKESANAPPDEPASAAPEEPGDPAPAAAEPEPETAAPPRSRRLLLVALLAAAAVAAFALLRERPAPAPLARSTPPARPVSPPANQLPPAPGPEVPVPEGMLPETLADAPEPPPEALADAPELPYGPELPPVPGPGLRAAELRSSGAEPALPDRLTPEDIEAAAMQAMPALRACKPRPDQTLIAQITVEDGRGAVHTIHGIDDLSLDGCIRRALRPVRYPLALTPSGTRVHFKF